MDEDKIAEEDLPELSSMHKDDFWLVAKQFRPDWTIEDFDKAWDDFVIASEAHYKQISLN